MPHDNVFPAFFLAFPVTASLTNPRGHDYTCEVRVFFFFTRLQVRTTDVTIYSRVSAAKPPFVFTRCDRNGTRIAV